MASPLHIGVLGLGHLGRIHVQQIAQVPELRLVGCFDPHPEKRDAIHREFGAEGFESVEALLERVDAIDIVAPTPAHHRLARLALEQGKHVFIEKPVTATVAEARDLEELARHKGLTAQVGHVERFNPAFQAALPHLKDPMFIETHRLAMFNPRGTDVSVVLDLMIHDIDIVLRVVGRPVVAVHASGVAVVSDSPDIANARIAFDNGCTANLTASRISLKNMRKSRFFQRDAYIAVDMLAKTTEIVRMSSQAGEPDPFAMTIDLGPGRGKRAISFDKPPVPETNAIREELKAFARAAIAGTEPMVTIGQAAEALEVAHRVLAGMSTPPVAAHTDPPPAALRT